MRIYYRAADAVVTSDHFVRRTPATTDAFLVCHLREVCILQARSSSPSRAALIGGALLALAVAASLWRFPLAFIGLAGMAAACTLLAFRHQPRQWLLQGVYLGETVTLYESADARVFNQVSRALRRAIEDGRPPRSTKDLTVT